VKLTVKNTKSADLVTPADKKRPKSAKFYFLVGSGVLILLILIFFAGMIFQNKLSQRFTPKQDLAKFEAEKERIAKELEDDGEFYFNCKHSYNFRYPKNWLLTDYTEDTDKTTVYKKGISISFTAFENEQNLNLEEWVDKQIQQIPGKVYEKEKIKQSGIDAFTVIFENPDVHATFWQEKDYFLQMLLSGENISQLDPEAGAIILTLKAGEGLPRCQTYSESQTTSGTVDPQTCSHPNGDVEYWWYSAPQSARDCYVARYGQMPPFLQQAQQPAAPAKSTVDPNTCQHPNGDVEYWWNQASEAERECFRLRNPDAPILRK